MQGFRALPSVDQLLQSETGLGLIAEHGRAMVTRTARARTGTAASWPELGTRRAEPGSGGTQSARAAGEGLGQVDFDGVFLRARFADSEAL